MNSWAGGRRRQYKVEAKSKVSLGVVHPLLPRLRLCEVAFGSFQGFPEADRAGGAGWATMGDFKIHKYYAVSSWFGSHAKAGGASQNVNFNHNIGR